MHLLVALRLTLQPVRLLHQGTRLNEVFAFL